MYAKMGKKPSGISSGIKSKNETVKIRAKVPEYQSEKWNEAKRHVENQIDKDFNEVKFENLQKVVPEWYEYVEHKEITNADLKDYFGGDLKGKTKSEIEDAKDELTREQDEIIWSTLFEAKNDHIAEKIRENKKKIQELGMTVIDLGNSEGSENYATGLFLGIRSAGHDFYESYWVPLWDIFGWLPNNK